SRVATGDRLLGFETLTVPPRTCVATPITSAAIATRRSTIFPACAMIAGLAMLITIFAAVAHAQTPPGSAVTGQAAEDSSIRPFKVQIPQAALDDLRRRIAATRWPDKETVTDASQGAQLAKLQELVRYWGSGYDWRKAEAKLNALPQFVTTIDGVDIHF